MAKAKIQGLDEAIEEMFKDYKKAIKKAAQEATDKTMLDITKKAVSCLQAYYDEYEPNVFTKDGNLYGYIRTYSLINSFEPYSDKVIEKDGNFICSAGINFNPDNIAETYYGSKQHSPVDGEWVIKNFLAGIHPRTDGSQIPGGGNYEDEKFQGLVVPGVILDSYINKYDDIFWRNYRLSLGRQVLNKVR